MGSKEHGRTARIAEQLRRGLAEILSRESSDPRMANVVVSAVKLSRDASHARVFVTLPQGTPPEPVVKALNRASGFFKQRLSERLSLRGIPRLRFEHDAQLEQAMSLTALIDSAVAQDQKKRDD